MKKLVDYLLSSIYLLYFGLILVIFHLAQVVAFNLFGRSAQKRMVDWLNAGITFGWLITGSRVRFNQPRPLPTDRPLILVANHQSMFDIPPIIWFLRRHWPTFVSKIELSKGIPSISYNLRKSGAALINRKDSKQAVVEIARMAKLIQNEKHAAVIFPEGTRSSTGKLKPFAVGGLSTLLKRAPDALIVPIAIDGTGRFNPKGIFPLRSFSTMNFHVLPTIEPGGLSPEEVTMAAERAITERLTGR